jgi:guanyl-specific ribonuclease Sa
MFPGEFLHFRYTLSLISVSRLRYHRLLLFLLCVFVMPAGLFSAAAPRVENLRLQRTDARVPAAAVEVYRHVLATGRAPAGHVGGRVWHNREHSLPSGGRYREYDVHPRVRGRNRGPERVIVDDATRRGWYTSDHYRTFHTIDLP